MSDYIATDADGTITLFHCKPKFMSEELREHAFWGGEWIKSTDYETLYFPEFFVYVKNAAQSLRKVNDISKYNFKPKYEIKKSTKKAQKIKKTP